MSKANLEKLVPAEARKASEGWAGNHMTTARIAPLPPAWRIKSRCATFLDRATFSTMMGGGGMRATAYALVAALSVAACATPYQPMGFGGGVSATQLDETTFRISGRGNAFTDAATIQNYVLLKAAEETASCGYDMFLIVSSADTSRSGTMVTPGQATSYTTGSATAFGSGNYATAVGSSTTQTYYTPGQTFSYVKPGEDVIVKMFQGSIPPDAPPNLFVASEVIKYLGPQVVK